MSDDLQLTRTDDVTDDGTIPPVVATVTVPCDVSTAFEIFTTDLASWWPLTDFSLGEGRIVAVEFATHVGGTVVEVWDDGTRRTWADVLAWDPPSSLSLSWNAGGYETGRPATRVDVTFTALADDETHVRLVHTGWEALGETALESRASYDEGWGIVLGRYVARF